MTRTPPSTLTARTPEDLLALATVVLGFHPEESLVMLTFGAGAFHARIDLPRSPAEVPVVVELLLEPLLRHRLTRVVFVVFSREPADPRLTSALVESCRSQGVHIIEALHADGRRWSPLLGPVPVPLPGPVPAQVGSAREQGQPYDLGSHRFLAEAVLRGQVTHATRERLAQSLEPVAEQVGELAALLGELPPVVPEHWAAERAWVRATVRRAGAGPGRLGLGAAARLARDLRDDGLRDTALREMDRETAPGHVELWTGLLRRAPDGYVAAPATLLGFAAWLGGQGALAWCAVERSGRDDPAYRLAELLARLLAGAVPPSIWPQVRGRVGVQDPA